MANLKCGSACFGSGDFPLPVPMWAISVCLCSNKMYRNHDGLSMNRLALGARAGERGTDVWRACLISLLSVVGGKFRVAVQLNSAGGAGIDARHTKSEHKRGY